MKKLTFKKKVTIIGINGFLGSNLASYLKKKFLIKKFNKINYNINYGTIIYCAGTTFVNKNYYNLVESHITLLNKIINKVQFEKLIYLSSTRVYMNAKETLTDTCFNKVSNKEDSIFNLSKILGESICLSSEKKTIIVRVSNIIGNNFKSNNFFYNIVKQSLKGEVHIDQTKESSKDYVGIKDFAKLIGKLIIKNNSKIYNIASGFNINNETIVKIILSKIKPKPIINYGNKKVILKKVNIDKIKKEFNFIPQDVKKIMSQLISSFKKN